MAFTTATVASITQGISQFQGVFSEMWAVRLTINPASIAAGAEDSANFTIPGLAIGDMVIGLAPGIDLTQDIITDARVSAANTLNIQLSNLHASSALDGATSTWKVLIGRPSW